MRTPSLPIELWNVVGHQDSIKRNDLCSLVRVNHLFLDIFIPILYTNIHIRAPDWNNWTPMHRFSTPFEYAGALARPLLEKLKSSPRLQDHVRTCRLGHAKVPQTRPILGHDWDPLVASIMLLLMRLPKINSVHLENFPCRPNWINQLASMPSVRTIVMDGICYSKTIEGNREYQTIPFTIQSFSTTITDFDWEIFGSMLFCTSLQHLHLPMCSISAFLSTHAKHGSPILTSLISLQLSFIGEGIFKFLEYTPNLVELKFYVRFKTQNPKPPHNWGHIVPKLERFEGCAHDIAMFTAGRPITTLLVMDSLWDREHRSAIANLPKRFGSAAAMRILEWTRCMNPNYLLDYLVDNGQQLEELIIDQYNVRQIKKDEVDTWLPKVEKLKKLRRLVLECSFGPSNSSMVAWEKERCEILQTRGCSDIVSICLRQGAVWTRHPDDSSWKIRESSVDFMY